eukprot:TRINITY_DN2598_c0_g1_i2.p1 TRINITY_DN2598_c0_g1~~TRINITY_DN2598_c0_g1_i2.p1  ORF type:complete len:145 (-),score=25.31 TRINITY_DN2598_c0_g1_i2:58-492(-)
MEQRYFAANPNIGEFIHWTTVGTLLDPYKVPDSIREQMARNLSDWEADQLTMRIPMLNKVLHSDSPLPNTSIVLYVHCEAGEDRTGEVSGSYYMQFLHWTFDQALNYDDHVESRDIEPESMHAMQWYCFYLQYALGYPTMTCGK